MPAPPFSSYFNHSLSQRLQPFCSTILFAPVHIALSVSIGKSLQNVQCIRPRHFLHRTQFGCATNKFPSIFFLLAFDLIIGLACTRLSPSIFFDGIRWPSYSMTGKYRIFNFQFILFCHFAVDWILFTSLFCFSKLLLFGFYASTN